ncbi:hypothetical protein C9374_006916 [Naegleria lovaniensis]|uniref:IPT/TIG domain-containing protein n=1 Tax=Naegleria lovaniensis TaxID=51637 RepID=A0AA88KXQ8_NAELO|nr:uncharacterized protein C9374_006916 [Naegleria lovaniensis]KAG2393385.1 hypothetical protein C9374_006916 [Naegleria lovaniensis]
MQKEDHQQQQRPTVLVVPSTTVGNHTNVFHLTEESQQQQHSTSSIPFIYQTTDNIDELFQIVQQPINFDDMSIIEQQLKSLNTTNTTMYNSNNYNHPLFNPLQYPLQQRSHMNVTNNTNISQQQDSGDDFLDIIEGNLFSEQQQQQPSTTTSHPTQAYHQNHIINFPTFTIPTSTSTIIPTSYLSMNGTTTTTLIRPPHLNNTPSPNMTNQSPFSGYIQANTNGSIKHTPNEQFASAVNIINELPSSPHDSSVSALSPQGNTILTTPSPQGSWDRFTFTSSQVPDLIKLVEGFNKPVKEKQIGGRDNTRHPLPNQVVELDVSKLPPGSNPSVISVRPVVMGVDRITRKTNRLAVLNEKPFVRVSTQPMERWIVVFDDIIIQFASHNNGQKLSLKFELLDAEKKVVCSIDSYGFETITKRGLEKIKERKKAKESKETNKDTTPKRKRGSDTEEDEEDGNEPTVEHVSPPYGFVSGGSLVKVIGTGFVSTPVSKCVVKFGERDAREIHTVKRNYIVCETPESDKTGIVDVSVKMGEDFIQSSAKFQYIDPNNPADLQIMIQHMLGSQNNINSNQFADASTFSNKCYDQSLFYSGKVTDECGFTVLHHATARGLFELCQYLVANSVCNIDAQDNFGRTALHWAVYASEVLVALYLVNNGASLCTKDEVGDNLLHIACRYASADFVKSFMSTLLKYDDNQFTNTSNISLLLSSTNNDGDTPLDLLRSMEQDDEVIELISVLERLTEACSARLSQIRVICSLKDILLRSGDYNGKCMTQLEGANLKISFSLQLEKDKILLLIDRSDTSIRALIRYEQVAFLILNKPQSQAEITLSSKPTLEVKDQFGNWTSLENHPYLSCSCFHLQATHSSLLDDVNKFISDNSLLFSFQHMVFSYRSPTNTHTAPVDKKSETVSKTSSNVDKFAEINKLSPTANVATTNNTSNQNMIQ